MEYCELSPDLKISRVLTGLWQIADIERGGKLDTSAAAELLAPYAEAGLSTFDMADHYGSAEEIAGYFQMQIRPEAPVQLLTKWVPKPGRVTKNDVREAVERSLNRLQTDRIDLLQFHAWNYADPSWLDCLFWLQELKSEGLIRHLGLTNVDAAHLRIALTSGIEIVSNQVCFSLIDQRPKNGMIELCEEHGVKLLVYGAIAGGFLTERWLGAPEPDTDKLPNWSLMKYKRFIDAAGGWGAFQEVLATVHSAAQKLDVSMANVAARYILDQPAVGGVIIGARLGKSEHIQDNLRLFEFTLDDESRDELEAALGKLQPVPGDCGDEYRKPPFLTASGDLSHHLDHLPPPYEAQPREQGGSMVLTGTPWEEIAGFSRAVRQGERILVSGTTATHGSRPIGGNDPAAQMHFIIDKIEGAIQSLGGRLEDVVRTRIFLDDPSLWEPISRAHGERFGHIQPVNTLVGAQVIGDEYLVEMEAEAIAR